MAKDSVELLRKHTSDQIALMRHILEAVERQREDEHVKGNLEANKVVIEIERVLNQHVTGLENLARNYGAEGESTVKKVVTEVAGMAAGLYDKLREQEVSRMLRDDYTALSLAAMGYTAYHTFGLAIKEQAVADLALRYLKDITPLLVELSRVLPVVVAEETIKELEAPAVDATIGSAAVRNTQQAWSREVVG